MSAYDMLPCTHRSHVSETDCTYAHKRLALEATMIRGLIRGLKRGGWVPAFVYDSGDQIKVKGETQTLDAVFSVDESTITFEKEGVRRGVLIVLGNGVDCIPDYNVSRSSDDGWNALVENVTDTLWERHQ